MSADPVTAGEVAEGLTRGQGLRASVSGSSPLTSYQDVIVGSRSVWELLRYEIVAVWGRLLPGAVGLAFRKLLWPGIFHAVGEGTVWGEGVVVRQPGKMAFGSRIVVDDHAYLDAKGCRRGEFVIGDRAMISRHVLLSAKEGGIRIGRRATIGAGCVLYSFGGIVIGDDTMMAANCYVGGGRYDHRASSERPMHQQPLPGRGVAIGTDCWIGANVTIVDGVSLGDGCVVGAGSVVLDDVDPGEIVAGVPAETIDHRFPPDQER